MSTQDERLKEIRANYFDALENEDTDLAVASSDAQKTMITANVRAARQTYWSAKAAQLSEAGAGVEAAYGAARAANTAVENARARAEAIPKVLKLAIEATNAAGDLLAHLIHRMPGIRWRA